MTKRRLAVAAAIFAASSFAIAAHAETVKCGGVNACKGQSACRTANSPGKGQNSCKGQGFKEMTQKDCDAAKAKEAQSK